MLQTAPNMTVPTHFRPLNPVEQWFAQATKQQRREYCREFYKECNRFPAWMKPQVIPEDMVGVILGVWRSRNHLAQAWPSSNPLVLCRLSINRAQIDENTGSWLPGISWDELWLIKNQCGYGNYDAVEVFPAEDKLVNQSNMRHLWVLKDRLTFGLQRD